MSIHLEKMVLASPVKGLKVHRASQFVAILTFIDLIQNSSTFGLVIDLGKSVNCLVDPPELGHSLS